MQIRKNDGGARYSQFLAALGRRRSGADCLRHRPPGGCRARYLSERLALLT